LDLPSTRGGLHGCFSFSPLQHGVRIVGVSDAQRQSRTVFVRVLQGSQKIVMMRDEFATSKLGWGYPFLTLIAASYASVAFNTTKLVTGAVTRELSGDPKYRKAS